MKKIRINKRHKELKCQNQQKENDKVQDELKWKNESKRGKK